MCYCPTPTLHLNLALTGDGAFLFSLKKTHSVWFISVLNYGDNENVLINHLLRVIPMSYPCHYTNLCPHKPHKHAHTHTHTHTLLYLDHENEFPSLVVWDGLAGDETSCADCVGQSGAWSTNLCISQPKPLCTFAGRLSVQDDLGGLCESHPAKQADFVPSQD